ncbi:hypothetical protein BLNAU_7210 [Blattamonas nauphoetae]|uniref:Right handed beta helix domain-containing protein n=1 Tax=Blattamonas nauphoetae TaxID=2049346 RepID=A0ABQ9Y214_9EUKA|nr:hypothetical protein BLNAU_7210 [Blattamonas nauphoetae]
MRNCPPSRIGAAWRIDLASREIKGCTIDQCSSSSTESAIIFDNIAQGTLTITNTNIGGILTKNTFDICIAEGGNGGGVWAHNDEAIRLENVEFGEEDIEPNWSSGSRDKQQHSSSLVFLANHNAGGPTYASGETITVKYTGFVNCVTISGHNKRGVVEMTSKRRVLSSDSDDPSTLTFQELTIDVSSSKLTSNNSFLTFEDGSRSSKKKQQDQPLSSQQEPMMDVVVKYDDFLSLLNPKPSNCKYSQPDDSVFPSKQNSDNLAQVLDCPFPHQGRVRWQENEDGRKTSSQGGQNSQGVSFKLNFAKATKHTTCPAPTSNKRICSSWTRQSDSSVTREISKHHRRGHDSDRDDEQSEWRKQAVDYCWTVEWATEKEEDEGKKALLPLFIPIVIMSGIVIVGAMVAMCVVVLMTSTTSFMPSTSLITRVFERRATTLGEGLDDVYQEASATNEFSTMEFGGIPIIIPSYNEVKVGCTSAM